MNKAQLAEAVAKELGLPPTRGARYVDAVLNVIARELLEGNAVLVTGFGTFEVVHREPRLARNPQSGERVHVPARDKPRWRPGRRLQGLLDGRLEPVDGSVIKKAPKGSLAKDRA